MVDVGRGVKKVGRNENLVLSRKRGFHEDPVETVSYELISCKPNNTFDPGSFVDINFHTGHSIHQMFTAPLLIEYQLQAKDLNGAWKASDAETDFGLPPVLGGNAFINGYELAVENTTVVKDTTNYGNLYQAVQRRMGSKEQQEQLGIFDVPERYDQLAALKVRMNKEMASVLGGQLCFASLDGCAFFGSQRCWSAEAVLPQKGSPFAPDYIPVNTMVRLRLRLHEKLHHRLCLAGGTYKDFIAPKKPADSENAAVKNSFAAQEFKETGYRMVITNMWLMCAKIALSQTSDLYKKIDSMPMELYVDIPRFSVVGLPENRQQIWTQHTISPETPIVYIVFPTSCQLSSDVGGGTRTSDISNFVLPSGLRSIGLRMDDAPIGFREPLTFVPEKKARSASVAFYYSYLKRLGLVTKSFRDWCNLAGVAGAGSAVSSETVNNVFMIDLTPFPKRTTAAQITCSLEFDGFSPKGFNIACVSVAEGSLGRDKQGHWYSNSPMPM